MDHASTTISGRAWKVEKERLSRALRRGNDDDTSCHTNLTTAHDDIQPRRKRAPKVTPPPPQGPPGRTSDLGHDDDALCRTNLTTARDDTFLSLNNSLKKKKKETKYNLRTAIFFHMTASAWAHMFSTERAPVTCQSDRDRGRGRGPRARATACASVAPSATETAQARLNVC